MERPATPIDLLFEKAENYSKTSIELLKLNVISKSADVLSSITSLFAIGTVVALFTLFLNIGLGLYIGKLLGDYYLGFFAVSGFYFLLAIIIFSVKEKYIKGKIMDLIISKLVTPKQ